MSAFEVSVIWSGVEVRAYWSVGGMFREESALRSTSPVHSLYTARWYGMRLPHGYEELTNEVIAVLGERKVKSSPGVKRGGGAHSNARF